MENPFTVLGLSPEGCTLADVRRAFRARAMGTHPDRGGDAAEFRAVREAYGSLREPALLEFAKRVHAARHSGARPGSVRNVPGWPYGSANGAGLFLPHELDPATYPPATGVRPADLGGLAAYDADPPPDGYDGRGLPKPPTALRYPALSFPEAGDPGRVIVASLWVVAGPDQVRRFVYGPPSWPPPPDLPLEWER